MRGKANTRGAGASQAPKRGRVRSVGALVDGAVRRSTQSRGFSEARLLTRWAEIAGPFAAVCRPVRVRYAKRGDAALVVLTTGAQAPVLQMRLEELRARVNACYGWNAIARIEITQTAPTGFGEAQAGYAPPPARRTPAPESRARATDAVAGVADEGLRLALERLGAHILDTTDRTRG